jgi:hypothetical protein
MDDAELWQAFEAQTLSERAWTHEAHLRTAFLFVARYDLDEAHILMRVGIIRLNARHGLVETATRGYFETMTRVWLILVRAAARQTQAPNSRVLLDRCPELSNRELPLRHYTRERLFNARARAVFVEPDLAPLPL